MDSLILYTSPFPKQRIGKPNDGGYVIVNLPGLYDFFISGGISDDISFEEDLLEIFPELTCFAFDGTINYLPKTNPRINFVKKNLGNVNAANLTNLHEYMKNYNNIFMKMDIEGHEFRILPTLIKNNYISKIKQLVIEIHTPADIGLFPDYFKGLQDIKNEHMFNVINNINKTHTLVHFHANNGPNIHTIDGINLPNVFELTFIRNEFVTEKIRNTDPLPTDIDMKNIVNKPDYTFSGFPYSI